MRGADSRLCAVSARAVVQDPEAERQVERGERVVDGSDGQQDEPRHLAVHGGGGGDGPEDVGFQRRPRRLYRGPHLDLQGQRFSTAAAASPAARLRWPIPLRTSHLGPFRRRPAPFRSLCRGVLPPDSKSRGRMGTVGDYVVCS